MFLYAGDSDNFAPPNSYVPSNCFGLTPCPWWEVQPPASPYGNPYPAGEFPGDYSYEQPWFLTIWNYLGNQIDSLDCPAAEYEMPYGRQWSYGMNDYLFESGDGSDAKRFDYFDRSDYHFLLMDATYTLLDRYRDYHRILPHSSAVQSNTNVVFFDGHAEAMWINGSLFTWLPGGFGSWTFKNYNSEFYYEPDRLNPDRHEEGAGNAAWKWNQIGENFDPTALAPL